MPVDRPRTFPEVFVRELEEIERRRQQQYVREDVAPKQTLVGLALSGSGIRSATFCLGLLQGLHGLKLLRIFDYLSTVSGGGFAGGWWSAWLTRDLFDARHIADPLRLAPTLVNDRLISRAVLSEVNLRDMLVRELNTLAERRNLWERAPFAGLSEAEELQAQAGRLSRSELRHRNVRLLRLRYPKELPEPFPPLLFPDREAIEPKRSPDYLNDAMPEGALAAGADPIHHLRLFSNYLTPRKGLLSADTWRAVATVSRNLVLTWFVLIPVLLGVVLLGQLYFVAQPFDIGVVRDFVTPPGTGGAADWSVILGRAWTAARVVGAVLVLLVVVTVLWMRFNNAGSPLTHDLSLAALALMIVGAMVIALPQRDGCGDLTECLRGLGESSPISAADLCLALLTAVAAALIWWRVVRLPRSNLAPSETARRKQIQSTQATRWHGWLLTTWVAATAVLVFAGFAHEAAAGVVQALSTLNLKSLGAALTVASTIAGTIFTALKLAPTGGGEAKGRTGAALPSRIVFALTPSLVLLLLGAAAACLTHTALAGVLVDPDVDLTVLTFEAMVGVGLCLVFAAYEAATGEGWRKWVLPGLCAALAGIALVTAGHALAFATDAPFFTSAIGTHGFALAFLLEFLAAAVVLVATGQWQRSENGRVLSLARFGGASLAALFLIAFRLADLPPVDDDRRLQWTALYAAVGLLTLIGSWVVALGWMADPNALSLHTFYRARLVRGYLGASNWKRNIERTEITDAVEGDDIALRALENCAHGGPYHLVNTTLNLVGGRDLSAAQRHAASFVLSKLYCGSVRTGYRETEEYMAGELTLGAAIAASGAAVSPEMGARTPSAALAMLLTLLNVRLGFWAPAPHRHHWRLPQARVWPYYVLRESLSQTTDLSSYCYLTDGGHFDNTGLYSLVERGCRFIVLVDNGADPQPDFEDLGDAIRRCRIDFEAEIDLDVSGFQPDGRPAPRHSVVGTVTYSEAHASQLGWPPGSDLTGSIVWFKPALGADEPADVRQYGLQHPVFPQQSTADQWFDEAQFESYRKLGQFCAEQAFAPARAALQRNGRLGDEQRLAAEDVRALFEGMRAGAGIS